MCIIVAKPAGVPLPPLATLRQCFRSNPDGAGYMVARGDRVDIRKGFMDLQSLLDALEAEGDITGQGAVLHFRIATHGGISEQCCHPFPVSERLEDLTLTRASASLGAAHNGVIQSMSPYAGPGRSDSMEYIRRVLAPLCQMMPGFMRNRAALNLIENTLGGRLALLEPDGTITTVGDFAEDLGGVLFSNTSYKTLDDFGELDECGPLEELQACGFDLYSALDALGMFPVCTDCPDLFDCAHLGAYCRDEADACAEVADALGLLDLDDDELAA